MSTKLPGRNPTAYLGIKETNPPELYFRNRAPLSTDVRPYDQGDIWIDQVNNHAYILVRKEGPVAFWEPCAGTGAAETLTGNTGGAVPPDGSDNINILGAGDLTVTGSPGTNTLTISDTGSQDVETLTGDSGGAVGPDGAGNINIVGGGGTTVSGNPGTNTLTVTSTGTGVDENQIIYVGKHGNDANDGRSIEEAKLTFGAAITAAAAIAPAVVVCFDAGTYTEAITLQPNVSIDAENATLTGTIVGVDDTYVELRKLIVPDTLTGVTKGTGTTYFNVHIEEIECPGTSIGLLCTAGSLNMKCRQLTIENGFGVGSTTTQDVHLEAEDIYITGAGVALAAGLGGTLEGEIQSIQNLGAGAGTAIANLGAAMTLVFNEIDVTTGVSGSAGVTSIIGNNLTGVAAYTLAGGATLNMTINSISGVETAGAGSVVNIYENTTGVKSNQPWNIQNPETANVHFNMTANGERTMPLQPSFSAELTNTQNNVTGDGTTYTVNAVAFTEHFDQNGDFDSATGIFTAPVTGIYLFNFRFFLAGLTVAHTSGRFFLQTPARVYEIFNCNPGVIQNSTNDFIINASVIADMTAADTAFISLVVANGALVVDLGGTLTQFSGHLLA